MERTRRGCRGSGEDATHGEETLVRGHVPNSDKIAGASVKYTGNSIDLVPGLEIVSEGDSTKLTFQKQGRASLSSFSQYTVSIAKPDDEKHQALVKEKLHVIESINRKLSYVLSEKDTCSCAEGERRS